MSQFFDYSRYYNLLYRDKDYAGEVEYVLSLIRKFHARPSDLLDIGCGTGRHAILMSQKGLKVHGVDLSAQMLSIARENAPTNVSFSQGDIRDFNLNRQFDVVTSLFHVMSYQTTNEDVSKAFTSAASHLKPGGVFIFDCWYGPGVMSDLPATRVRRMEDELMQVVRISEPRMDFNKCLVEVNFDVSVIEKKTSHCQNIKEQHLMRFFFENELLLFGRAAGLEHLGTFGWLSNERPDRNTWYATFVWRKGQ